MDDHELAREFMRRGIEWMPGMVDDSGDRVMSVEPDGLRLADWALDDLVEPDVMGLPDLTDPLTLAGIELQVRDKLEARPNTLWVKARYQGSNYMQLWTNVKGEEWDGRKDLVLLAALRAANERGEVG